MKIKFTLLTSMLGTLPSDQEVFKTYVASKAPEESGEESLATPEEVEKKGTTIFHRNDQGELILRDYLIKGALKARADAIRARKGKGKDEKGNWGSIRGKIDEDVHVYPEMISLGITEPDGMYERPLRAMTAQGPRVSLANSETVNAGRSWECEILLRPGRITEKMLIEILDELQYVGFGQWRNAGHGRTSYTITEGAPDV